MSEEERAAFSEYNILLRKRREAHTDWTWDLHHRGIRRGRKLYNECRAIDPKHPRLAALQHCCFACRMYAGGRLNGDGERSVTIGYAEGEIAWMGAYKCGAGRFCLLCGARIAAKNQEDIQKGLENAIKKGGFALALTYTIPHRPTQSAMELVQNLAQACTLAGKGGDVTRFREQFGVLGSVVRQEETYGPNGWHPHRHTLLFFNHVLSEDEVAEASKKLEQKWQAACYKIGIVPSNRTQAFKRHGFRADPVFDTKSIAEYLSKVGWKNSSTAFKVKATESVLKDSTKRISGAAFELASRDSKAPHMAEGRTPWDIHEGFVNGNPRDTELWLDYIAAFSDKPMVRWSPRLKAILGIRDKDEEKMVEADEEDSLAHIYRINADQYADGVARNGLWRPIIKAVDTGDFDALQAIADRYVIDFKRTEKANGRYPEILSQQSFQIAEAEAEADMRQLRRKEADKRRRAEAARLKAEQEAKERARVAAEQAYTVSLLSSDDVTRLKAGLLVHRREKQEERRKRRDLRRKAKTRGRGSVPVPSGDK